MIKLTIKGKPYYLSGDIKQEQDVRREILSLYSGLTMVEISGEGIETERVRLYVIFKK